MFFNLISENTLKQRKTEKNTSLLKNSGKEQSSNSRGWAGKARQVESSRKSKNEAEYHVDPERSQAETRHSCQR